MGCFGFGSWWYETTSQHPCYLFCNLFLSFFLSLCLGNGDPTYVSGLTFIEQNLAYSSVAADGIAGIDAYDFSLIQAPADCPATEPGCASAPVDDIWFEGCFQLVAAY